MVEAKVKTTFARLAMMKARHEGISYEYGVHVLNIMQQNADAILSALRAAEANVSGEEMRERAARWHEVRLVPEHGIEWGLMDDDDREWFKEYNEIHSSSAAGIRALPLTKET